MEKRFVDIEVTKLSTKLTVAARGGSSPNSPGAPMQLVWAKLIPEEQQRKRLACVFIAVCQVIWWCPLQFSHKPLPASSHEITGGRNVFWSQTPSMLLHATLSHNQIDFPLQALLDSGPKQNVLDSQLVQAKVSHKNLIHLQSAILNKQGSRYFLGPFNAIVSYCPGFPNSKPNVLSSSPEHGPPPILKAKFILLSKII